MLSVPGAGEIPIGIASSPLDKGYIEFTVKRYPTGVVTTALHDLSEGDTMGVRGPLGNSFPLDELKGKNLVIIGGGFAFTTLRATIRYLLTDASGVITTPSPFYTARAAPASFSINPSLSSGRSAAT